MISVEMRRAHLIISRLLCEVGRTDAVVLGTREKQDGAYLKTNQ